MATQHPDNAHAPYWEKDGDGFVSIYEEMDECASAFQDLDVDEFMWDWEGKYADEAVIDKLFSKYYDYFKKHQLGRDKFLTFRLPNVSQEKGYGLIRGLMVILTSEDFARDIGLAQRPLFEIILPMVEHEDHILYPQKAFQKLADFKSDTFTHEQHRNTNYINIIPLVESAESQIAIHTLLSAYVTKHREFFGHTPPYIRPFLAGSDPALVSGFLPSLLGSKIALSEIARFTKESGIPTYPMIGVGSLLFRGGLNPRSYTSFLKQYGGIRTVTLQSSFRYDYPLEEVKKAITYLKKELPYSPTVTVEQQDRSVLESIIEQSTTLYRATITSIAPQMQPIFDLVPSRRERKLHIGLLAYGRTMGELKLPRAIKFTGACYSVGIPPELIGTGRMLAQLTESELAVLRKYYVNMDEDLEEMGHFLNRENLMLFKRDNAAWADIEEDVAGIEHILGKSIGPDSRRDYLHKNVSSNVYLLRNKPTQAMPLVIESAKIRRSLG